MIGSHKDKKIDRLKPEIATVVGSNGHTLILLLYGFKVGKRSSRINHI